MSALFKKRVNVQRCPRCRQAHRRLLFRGSWENRHRKEFGDWLTHEAFCPATKQTIRLDFYPTGRLHEQLYDAL